MLGRTPLGPGNNITPAPVSGVLYILAKPHLEVTPVMDKWINNVGLPYVQRELVNRGVNYMRGRPSKRQWWESDLPDFRGRRAVPVSRSGRALGDRSRLRGSRAAPPMTFQHDYAHIYSRKRAPYAVRRAAKSSSDKFKKNLVSSLGQKTYSISDVYQPSSAITPPSLNDCQTVVSLGLYGAAVESGPTTNTLWSDLYIIAQGNGTGIEDVAGKLWFSNAVLDVQIRSKMETGILHLEVYTVEARREGFFDPAIDWTNAMSEQDLLDVSGVKLKPQSLNAVPFDGPGFGSSWLVSKKERFRISPGNSVYLQIRDSKNKCFDTDRFNYNPATGLPQIKMFRGFTKGYIFVFRSTEATTTGEPEVKTLVPYDFEIIYTKSYHFVQQESNRAGQAQYVLP